LIEKRCGRIDYRHGRTERVVLKTGEPGFLSHRTKPLGDFPVTLLSQRVDSAFSTFAMFGMLSPLVLAAILTVVAH
jgi:hypothetical protein